MRFLISFKHLNFFAQITSSLAVCKVKVKVICAIKKVLSHYFNLRENLRKYYTTIDYGCQHPNHPDQVHKRSILVTLYVISSQVLSSSSTFLILTTILMMSPRKRNNATMPHPKMMLALSEYPSAAP